MTDSELWRNYRRDGHATVRTLVGFDIVGDARRHLAHLQTQPGGDHPGGIVTAALDDPAVSSIAADPSIIGVAAALLGGVPEPFGCTYLVKPPRLGLPVLWHQDGHPWGPRLGGRAALTVWLALDEATPDNGCLRVIPGSQALPAQPLRPNTRPPNVFGHEIDPALVDATAAVDVLLAAGDASVHHPNLIHGSGPNRSDHTRTALALRFAACVPSR